jgi:hypothetical protein
MVCDMCSLFSRACSPYVYQACKWKSREPLESTFLSSTSPTGRLSSRKYSTFGGHIRVQWSPQLPQLHPCNFMNAAPQSGASRSTHSHGVIFQSLHLQATLFRCHTTAAMATPGPSFLGIIGHQRLQDDHQCLPHDHGSAQAHGHIYSLAPCLPIWIAREFLEGHSCLHWRHRCLAGTYGATVSAAAPSGTANLHRKWAPADCLDLFPHLGCKYKLTYSSLLQRSGRREIHIDHRHSCTAQALTLPKSEVLG